MLELFYDLVFVFAITQISHYLLDHQSWEGAGQAALILLVVWWSWNFTTWFTNELDPTETSVVALMLALMLASMLMSIAIPEAFGDRALLFAGAYVAIQLGRTSFLAFFASDRDTVERRRAAHIVVWFTVAAVGWIAGALADGEVRTILWLAALLVDYIGPLFTYRVPGMSRVGSGDWQVGSEHFAERFQLFVIIALGESIVITGTTTSGLELDGPTIAAFIVAFLGTAALWWLYFNAVAERAHRGLADAADRTLVARDIYTYLHVLVIAGIVVVAVADDLVLVHPTEPLDTPGVVTLIAGPVIYLLAQASIRLRMAHSLSRRRIAGITGLIVVGIALSGADALVLALGLLVVMTALVIADVMAARRLRAASAEG
jgi:low temperature requirement protein LtrA